MLVSYLVFIWINIVLLFGSFQARSWRNGFHVPCSDYSSTTITYYGDYHLASELIFPFPSRDTGRYGQGNCWVNAWDIKTYDWTEFVASLVIPLLCIITCLLVTEMVDKIKSTSPDNSINIKYEDVSIQ